MTLSVLRKGSEGEHVAAWEGYLRSEGYYLVEVDGFFNEDTVEATKEFQRRHGLTADGQVGKFTWAAAIADGFHILEDDSPSTDQKSPNWPPPPSFRGTDYRTREKYFGHIEFVAAGSAANPEAIKITNNWEKDNLTTVEVPQMLQVRGTVWNGQTYGQGPRKVRVHKKVAQPLLDLWAAWEDAGLLDRILTFDGLHVARFIRGSRTTLSNHSYGAAFDINASWNGLRKTPALFGQKGCVRELVPSANKLGWFWLGHSPVSDGQHFEWVPPEMR